MRKPDLLQRVLRPRYRRKMAQAQLLTEHELAQSAMVFAPHPDDEILACGGTLLRKQLAGARVIVVYLTDGGASHASLIPTDTMSEIRREEAIAACQTLGVDCDHIFFLNFPDAHLSDYLNPATTRVKDLLARFRPQEIFLPYQYEPPSDHAAAYKIILDALADPELAHLPKPILNEYPVWYWYHWPWVSLRQGRRSDTLNVLRLTLKTSFGAQMSKRFTHAVEIESVSHGKYSALAAYRSQMMPLMPDMDWPTLADISGGEFLDCFFQDREFFFRHPV